MSIAHVQNRFEYLNVKPHANKSPSLPTAKYILPYIEVYIYIPTFKKFLSMYTYLENFKCSVINMT